MRTGSLAGWWRTWLLVGLAALGVLTVADGRQAAGDCVLLVGPSGGYADIGSALGAIEGLPAAECPKGGALGLPTVVVSLDAEATFSGPGNVGLAYALPNISLEFQRQGATGAALLDGGNSSFILRLSGAGAASFSNVDFFRGFSPSGGGCLAVEGAVLLLSASNASFLSCLSAAPGGALLFSPSAPASLLLDRVLFDSSASLSSGGALSSSPLVAASLSSSVFQFCSSAGDGGALHSSGPLLLSQTTFRRNSAGSRGGALSVALSPQPQSPRLLYPTPLSGVMPVWLRGVQFLENEAASGGALALALREPCAVAVADSSFSGNIAHIGGGGAISVIGDGAPLSSQLLLSASTFSRNSCSSCSGGALYGAGFVDLRALNCSFSNNDAASSSSSCLFVGGALAMADGGGAATFTACDFSQNAAGGLGADVALLANGLIPQNAPRGLNLYGTQLSNDASVLQRVSARCVSNASTAPSALPLKLQIYQDGSDSSAVFSSFSCPHNSCEGCPYQSCAVVLSPAGEPSGCSCFYAPPPPAQSSPFKWYFSTGHLVGLGIGAAAITWLLIGVPVATAYFLRKKMQKPTPIMVLPSVRLNPAFSTSIQGGGIPQDLLSSSSSPAHLGTSAFKDSPSKMDYFLAPPMARTAETVGEYFNLSDDDDDSD